MNTLEIQTATPAEIDTHYAPIWHRYLTAAQARSTASRLASKLNGSTNSADCRRREAARTAVRKADAVIAEVGKDIDRYNTEWANRGGWSQVWLCTSSDNGHFHRSKHCGSLRWNSEIGLIPVFSGLTEAQIVEAIGSDACTRCYPNAPVDKPSTVGPLFEQRQADAAARAEREAELATKRAAADAKAITAPDGTALRDDMDMVIKTERTAQMYYVEAACDAITWADPRMIERCPDVWARNSARAAEYSLRLLAALAHKNGETRNQAQARLESKVQAKVRAFWK
jgi:hypothetical protein